MATNRPDLLTETPKGEGYRDDLESAGFKGKLSRFERLSTGDADKDGGCKDGDNGVKVEGELGKPSDNDHQSVTNPREPIYDMLSELENAATLRKSKTGDARSTSQTAPDASVCSTMPRSFVEQQRSMEAKPEPGSVGYYDRVADCTSGGAGDKLGGVTTGPPCVPVTNSLMPCYADDAIYGDAQFALYDNFQAKVDAQRSETLIPAFPVEVNHNNVQVAEGGGAPSNDSGQDAANDVYDNLENVHCRPAEQQSAAGRLKAARERVNARLPDFIESHQLPPMAPKSSPPPTTRASDTPLFDTPPSPALKSSVRAMSPAGSDASAGKSVKWSDDRKAGESTKSVSEGGRASFKCGNSEVSDFDSQTPRNVESRDAHVTNNVNPTSTTANPTAAPTTNGTNGTTSTANGVHTARQVCLDQTHNAYLQGMDEYKPSPAGHLAEEEEAVYANETRAATSSAVDLHARASADRELERGEAEKERNRLDDILNLCARYERQLDYELLPAERDPNIHGRNAVGGSLSRMKTNGSLTRDLSNKIDSCMGGPSECRTPPTSTRHAPSTTPRHTSSSASASQPHAASASSPPPVMRPLNSGRESTPDQDYNSLARSHGVSLPKPVQSCDEIRNKLVSLRDHRDVLTTSIQDLKSQINLIEQQQNEAINQSHESQFELEQALMEGESAAAEAKIQKKIDNLKSKQTTLVQSSDKQKKRVQAEIAAARDTLSFLEEEQTTLTNDLNDPKVSVRSNELRRRLSSNSDRCEAKKRAIDDLEFQLLEIETAQEASKDNLQLQLTVEQNNLKNPEKLVDPEFEQQKKEIKSEFKNELRQMELVRKQCIKDYQKGNTMLREIEGNITNSEVLLSEKLKLDNTYTDAVLKNKEMIANNAYSTCKARDSTTPTRTLDTPDMTPKLTSKATPSRSKQDDDDKFRQSADGSNSLSSLSEFTNQSNNSSDELQKRLSPQDSPKSDTEQLKIEREKNRDLENKLEKEQQMRTQMIEEAIVRRNKQNQLQSRPLTRFLPVKEMADFDLRNHIETSGHALEAIAESTVCIDSTSCRGYLMKLGAKGLRGWNKRWFVFDRVRHALFYYVDRNEKKHPKSTIYFQAIEQVFVEPSRKRISGSGSQKKKGKGGSESSSFVVKTSQRSYVLTAPTPQIMRIWIDVIFTGAEGNKDFD